MFSFVICRSMCLSHLLPPDNVRASTRSRSGSPIKEKEQTKDKVQDGPSASASTCPEPEVNPEQQLLPEVDPLPGSSSSNSSAPASSNTSSDTEEVKDQRICPICTQWSDKPHMIHYGGLCCFSCKAFFRRTHHESRKRPIYCKKDGQCPITTRRKKCRKCRYDKCIANGMRPDGVLNEEQRKVRFRNALRKKELASNSRDYLPSSDSDSDQGPDGERTISPTFPVPRPHGVKAKRQQSQQSSRSEEGEESIIESLSGLRDTASLSPSRSCASSSGYASTSSSTLPSSTSTSTSTPVLIKFNENEDTWLQGRFELFNKCYASVNLGEETIKDFVTYSLDVPLSKKFIPNAMEVMVERFRRVFINQPEVAGLSQQQKGELSNTNVMECVALAVSKLETCVTGQDQLKYMCGLLDELQWTRDFEDFFSKGKQSVRKLVLAESNKNTPVLDTELMKEFNRLTQSIGSYIQDDDKYKLMILAVMFRGLSTSSIPEVASLSNQYMAILKRKTILQTHKSTSSDKADSDFEDIFFSALSEDLLPVSDNDNTLDQLITMFCEIRDLSNILKKIQN